MSFSHRTDMIYFITCELVHYSLRNRGLRYLYLLYTISYRLYSKHLYTYIIYTPYVYVPTSCKICPRKVFEIRIDY